jgi:hypothetical protein
LLGPFADGRHFLAHRVTPTAILPRRGFRGQEARRGGLNLVIE